jgi:hypothetical protein
VACRRGGCPSPEPTFPSRLSSRQGRGRSLAPTGLRGEGQECHPRPLGVTRRPVLPLLPRSRLRLLPADVPAAPASCGFPGSFSTLPPVEFPFLFLLDSCTNLMNEQKKKKTCKVVEGPPGGLVSPVEGRLWRKTVTLCAREPLAPRFPDRHSTILFPTILRFDY